MLPPPVWIAAGARVNRLTLDPALEPTIVRLSIRYSVLIVPSWLGHGVQPGSIDFWILPARHIGSSRGVTS